MNGCQSILRKKPTEEEMMNIIFELLETWKRKKGSAQNE